MWGVTRRYTTRGSSSFDICSSFFVSPLLRPLLFTCSRRCPTAARLLLCYYFLFELCLSSPTQRNVTMTDAGDEATAEMMFFFCCLRDKTRCSQPWRLAFLFHVDGVCERVESIENVVALSLAHSTHTSSPSLPRSPIADAQLEISFPSMSVRGPLF